MRTKKKDYEKLSDANIKHVIELLEAEKPVTKKEACGVLNISYNTTRLNNIIQEFKETQEFRAKRKAEKKGTGATKDEIKAVVQSYLDGDNISDIASDLYRSPAFVRGIIDRVGIPRKQPSEEYNWKMVELPEQCISEQFTKDEIVWCLRENCTAIVTNEWQTREGEYGYTMYTIECTDLTESLFPHIEFAGRYVNSLACNIGSLKHLEEYGVRTEHIRR